MLRSMTGFGTGRSSVEGEELSVEVRTVNHKYCEVKVRLPRELSSLEPRLVQLVKGRIARGAVEVSAKRQTPASAAATPKLDLPLAAEYLGALRRLASELGLPEAVAVRDLFAQPGVLTLEERELKLGPTFESLQSALLQALDSVTQMRVAEGQAIHADLLARLQAIEALSREVASLAPQAVEAYHQRLLERVSELSRGVPADPQRLAQEVAFFAERTDVAEELTRLFSHLRQFQELLQSSEPVGRKLDFLTQELNREVNTTGSKSQHPEISSRVVAIKAELERIREQVQNVE